MIIKEHWKFPVTTGGHINNVQFIHKTKDASILFDYFGEDGEKYNVSLSSNSSCL